MDTVGVGQRVITILVTGTWQELIVVAASQVVAIPDSLDDSTACQLTTSPLTALLLVREIGVQPGDRHLQTAAGSTVGKLVVQLARHRGIPTINVVRRRAAVAEIRQLGAGQPHRAGDHRGTPTAPGSGGRRSLAANEPSVEVAAVEDQLAHAVSNLVDNAARYATSIVRITLSCYDDTARIVVDDDGLGISPADHERLFERFTRLDDSRARPQGGSGLGLAVVRAIVSRHNGQIRVEDSPLGGARFVVELPREANDVGVPPRVRSVAAHSPQRHLVGLKPNRCLPCRAERSHDRPARTG